jgi:hypothetical protein
VREARRVVTENADALPRTQRPSVPPPPFAICLLAEKIKLTKRNKRGKPMTMYTAIQEAARLLLKDKQAVKAATKAAWRLVKSGAWGLLTK